LCGALAIEPSGGGSMNLKQAFICDL